MVAAALKLGIRRLVLCGGVAANSRLRGLAQERASERSLELFLPPVALCTDNGAMIAVTGYETFMRQGAARLDLNADPAWRL